MKKNLRVTMSDRSQWDIPAEYIARNRAVYYATVDAGRMPDWDQLSEAQKAERCQDLIDTEIATGLACPSELIDWADNNMLWDDVEKVAQRVPNKPASVNYHVDWTNADKEIVEESAE